MWVAFEFGIDRGSEFRIRWPSAVDEDALRFAVDIPEDTVLRVVYGPPAQQVASARETARHPVAAA